MQDLENIFHISDESKISLHGTTSPRPFGRPTEILTLRVCFYMTRPTGCCVHALCPARNVLLAYLPTTARRFDACPYLSLPVYVSAFLCSMRKVGYLNRLVHRRSLLCDACIEYIGRAYHWCIAVI